MSQVFYTKLDLELLDCTLSRVMQNSGLGLEFDYCYYGLAWTYTQICRNEPENLFEQLTVKIFYWIMPFFIVVKGLELLAFSRFTLFMGH